MKIAIIIVTYNAMKWLKKCMDSIENSSVSLQTFVIDNGSTDGTIECIQQNFPEVNLTISKENLGFGKANNLGLENAYQWGAEFFYLMNQDAWLFPDTVENLLKVYTSCSKKEEIGILSPMQWAGDEKHLDIFLDKYIGQNFRNRMISDLYFQTLKPYYELDFINAAHWFLPKSTIEEVGGFNPYIFHYGEDNEYVNRLHFQGKKIFLTTQSKAIHDGIQELNKVDYSKFENKVVEIELLNPNTSFNIKKEIQSHYQGLLKQKLAGNKEQTQVLQQKLKSLKKDKNILKEYYKANQKVQPNYLNLKS